MVGLGDVNHKTDGSGTGMVMGYEGREGAELKFVRRRLTYVESPHIVVISASSRDDLTCW
jgi:hypothetical protein